MDNETFERASKIKGKIEKLQYDLAAIEGSSVQVIFIRTGRPQIGVNLPAEKAEELHNFILDDYTKRIDELQKEFDAL